MAPGPEAEVERLIDEALAADVDSDERWASVWALQRRGDRPSFDAAVELCKSPEPSRRELGVDILAQLGVRAADVKAEHVTLEVYADDRPFRGPAVDLFLDLLSHEQDTRVLASLASGLGHLEDERAIEPLVGLRSHKSEDVRYSVVHGLLGHDSDLAVEALIELSRDRDPDVRDWATFGLGSQIDRDTTQVREALAARLDDPDGDTSEEAIVGLAVRGDARALEPLLTLLDDDWEGPLLSESLYNLSAHLDDERLTAHLAKHWTARCNQPEFSPRTITNDETLLTAARRHGLTDSAMDDS